MKKLFATYYPAKARVCYVRSRQGLIKEQVNGYFAQDCSYWPTLSGIITDANYAQSNLFIFFIDSATYKNGNALLLTYNTEISHTYKPMLSTSINFSRPTDVIASVLLPNSNERVTVQINRKIHNHDSC